jgi:hypothetical protein
MILLTKRNIFILFVMFIIVGSIIYFTTLNRGGRSKSQTDIDYVSRCDKLIPYNSLSISPIAPDHIGDHRNPLRDYYIKCAFNACSSGKFEGGAVELCALDNCLKNGSRGLDFEIYSVDGEPIISCSNYRKGTTKGTDNHLNFNEVMRYIDINAFSETFCPKNYTDPLLINLRIHVEDENLIKDIYNKIATTIADVFNKSGRLIHSPYKGKKSIGEKPLLDCRRCVIIMVDGTNIPLFESSNLAYYTNIHSTPFSQETRRYTNMEIRTLSENDEDKGELIKHHNNGKMSMVIPEGSPRNLSFVEHKELGVSMFFMCNQLDDDNIKEYHKFFSEGGTSFVKKPQNLISIPVVEKTPEQYTSKDVNKKGAYYEFSL